MAKIISIDTLKAERSQKKLAKEIQAKVGGEIVVIPYEYGDSAKLTKEIITSADGAKALAEKIVLDLENGREEVPRLYESIYDVHEDSSYPRHVSLRHALRGRVVFLKRLEGGEVKFGTVSAKDKDVVEIVTYSGGFEYTREMELYNELFSMDELHESAGEANNALLNHVHLNPIIGFSYTTKNKQAAVTDSTDANIQMRETIEAAIVKARNNLPKIGGSFNTILASPADQFRIDRALAAQTIEGTIYPANDVITNIVYYDGWEGEVANKTYNYSGVTSGKAYLIRPRGRGFHSFVKEDMTIEIGSADVSRGIRDQVAYHTSLGVFAGVEDNVIEITLP